MVAHLTFNQRVAGSTPAGHTIFLKGSIMNYKISYDKLTHEAENFLAVNAVKIGSQVLKNEMNNGNSFIFEETPIYEVCAERTEKMEEYPYSEVVLHSYVIKNGAVVKEVVQAWAAQSEYECEARLALQTTSGKLIGLWPEFHFDPDDIVLREQK